ncbi:MAG: uncharacterized protein K0R61_61 [Microvirga sp.]|nr:uncharacterized protein [Microvirga sp.]MDF2969611.1 uncharacterized protein [Microvirga sp.]
MSPPWEKYAKTEGPWAKYAPAPVEAGGGGVQDWEPEGYTEGQKVKRKVGLGAQGVNDAIANTVGAPVDAVAWGLRQLGVPVDKPVGGSDSIKAGIDYVATLPGRVHEFTDILRPKKGTLTDDRTSRLQPVTTGEKTAYGVGEGVGNALTVLAPAAAVANTARAGTVTQGVANVLRTQPGTQLLAGATAGGVTGATDNPWLGLAAGAAVPLGMAALRGIVSPTTNRLTPQEQRIVQTADTEGVRLTPAQRTGSPALKGIEGTMAGTPGPSGPMQRAISNQRTDLNKAVLAKAGVTAGDASPETVGRAFKNIGQTFDDLASRTTLKADTQFADDVQKVAQDYGRRLETNVAGIFQSYMDDLAPLVKSIREGSNDPQIAGETYARIRSDIGRTIRANGRNPDLQRALGGIQDAMDDVVERSASGALRQEWRDTRRQYQALMTIDKAMQGGTQADRSAGNIPLNALRQAVAQGDRAGYSRGRGQLNELSRVGDFIGQRIPDSGTAGREAVLNPLKWPVMGAMNVFARGYNSPAGNAYFTNQLAGPTDFRALYAAQMARQALEEANGNNALVGGQ